MITNLNKSELVRTYLVIVLNWVTIQTKDILKLIKTLNEDRPFKVVRIKDYKMII